MQFAYIWSTDKAVINLLDIGEPLFKVIPLKSTELMPSFKGITYLYVHVDDKYLNVLIYREIFTSLNASMMIKFIIPLGLDTQIGITLIQD